MKRMLLSGLILIGIVMFLHWGNNSIVVSKYSYCTNNVSKKLDGVKILHISDFHNKEFGKNSEKIIKKIKEQKPDIIVITGDIIDRRRYNLEIALELSKEIIKIAPSYYISGNHEAWSGEYETIKENLENEGVIVLEDEQMNFKFNGEEIEIFGIKENMEGKGGLSSLSINALKEYKSNLKAEPNLSILLAHRPELFPIYQSYPFDLVFTGHAHGGQIRLPFLGALFAPNQGLLPKYHSGEYSENSQTMFLSRGLGNSIFPIRILNRPELILIEIKHTA